MWPARNLQAIMQERGNGYWEQGAVSDRVTLSKCKSGHVTLLKIVERLPTHSGKKPKPLQCPTEPYMSCRSYLSDLISFSSLPCLFCYSHIGLLAGFLTSQSHSCLNISSEPLEASLARHALISDLSSLGHAQISLHQRPPYRKQYTPPQ